MTQGMYGVEDPDAARAVNAGGSAKADGVAGSAGGRNRNPLGVVALVVGVVGILFNVLFTLVQAVAAGQGMYELLSAFGVAHSILSIVIALATIALGAMALLRKNAPKGAAGAGTALGAASLVSVLTGLLYSGVIQAVSTF